VRVLSEVSRIKNTGLWPVDGGLDEQDSGLVYLYLMVTNIQKEAEHEQYEKQLRSLQDSR